MAERFPGSSTEIEKYLDIFTRDYEEYQGFQATRDDFFAELASLHNEYDPDSADRVDELLEDLVDRFVAYSRTILGRQQKEIAVDDWVKLMTSDDLYQQRMFGNITGQTAATGTSDAATLERHAWSYIKQHDLYQTDEYDLQKRIDLDTEQWIDYGYEGILRRRVVESLRQNSVGHSVDVESDDNDPQNANLDLYTTASDIYSEIQQVFASTSEYLDYYRPFVDDTDTFKAYQRKAKYIDAIIRQFNNINPFSDLGRKQDCEILQNPAFLDGFRFAMLTNNRLLDPGAAPLDLSGLDKLTPYALTKMQEIVEIAEDGTEIDDEIYEHGIWLYDNNLVHPDNPDAKRLNSQQNPFKELAELAAIDLYSDGKEINDDSEGYDDAMDFYAGFGIGRTIYNAYQMELSQDNIDQ